MTRIVTGFGEERKQMETCNREDMVTWGEASCILIGCETM